MWSGAMLLISTHRPGFAFVTAAFLNADTSGVGSTPILHPPRMAAIRVPSVCQKSRSQPLVSGQIALGDSL